MTSPALYPSYGSCVAKALRASRRPLSIDEIIVAVENERPIGKRVDIAIKRALDNIFQAVATGNDSYGWLTYLLDGINVCHPLTGDEITGGFLLLDELEHTVFFPRFFEQFEPDGRVVTISLFGGPTIESTASIEQNTWSLQLGPQFVKWLDYLGVENRDDMLINVIDAEEGYYELRTRLREMRDDRIVEERNIRLAMIAEELVAEGSLQKTTVPVWDLAARLIGRGFFKHKNPSDDLHYVLSEYSILQFEEGEGYRLAKATRNEPSKPVYSVEEAREILSELLSEWQQRESVLNKLHADRVDDRLVDEIDMLAHGTTCNLDGEGQECLGYQEYLRRHNYELGNEVPLNHEQYHLLEAEMNVLFSLELEFGMLLPEQENRIDQLTRRLLLNSGSHESIDWGGSDDASSDDRLNRH